MRKWEFCHANGDLDLTRETGAAMTDVRDQGRALGDRTRYAIFETLRDAAGPLTVAQLAAQFTLHPNAIRLHLGKLRDASLVIEETAAPRGRGRPALLYRVSPGAVERWESATPHEELSLMLLEMLEEGRSPREVGRDTGARLAVSLDRSGRADPVDLLVGVTRQLGFEPQVPAAPAPRGRTTRSCCIAARLPSAPSAPRRSCASCIVGWPRGSGRGRSLRSRTSWCATLIRLAAGSAIALRNRPLNDVSAGPLSEAGRCLGCLARHHATAGGGAPCAR